MLLIILSTQIVIGNSFMTIYNNLIAAEDQEDIRNGDSYKDELFSLTYYQ